MVPRTRRQAHNSHFSILLDNLHDVIYIREKKVAPNDYYDRITRAVEQPLSTDQIKQLVQLLESPDASNCRKLPTHVFSSVCGLVIDAEQCLAKERGLYLLTESFRPCPEYEEIEDSQQLSPTENQRKKEIGAKVLGKLVDSFIDTHNLERPRRWAGLFVLELLKKSESNVIILLNSPEARRRALGDLILTDDNALLKVISGQIIRNIVEFAESPQIFWPTNATDEAINTFPQASDSHSRWVKDFTSYCTNLLPLPD
ncbi:MAG: hypothetical protein M1834_006388 [Cirrosporium novae-zelandiae]|nr:MAG: hypothetical protein M1834_006388 [Cirrosporium novae-zelandiae]